MTVDEARTWLIKASLIATGSQMVFLILAPTFGFPLAWPKNLDIIQIITPVFLGYLGAATHFIFIVPTPAVTVNNQYLGVILKGAIYIYAAVVISAFVAFGWTNRVGAPIGSNVTVDNLTNALSAALGVLAVTTGIMSAYLFAVERKPEQ
jgi:hypothetical protein